MVAIAFAASLYADDADACTGISLVAKDGSKVVARTVEWAATPMQCGYVVSPRGHMHQSYTPTGENGIKYNLPNGKLTVTKGSTFLTSETNLSKGTDTTAT